MEDLMHWFLTSVVGPLMLPLFALATLCMIAGAKPEPIVSGFVGLFVAVVNGLFGLLAAVVKGLAYRGGYRKTYPPTSPGRKYPYPPKPKGDEG